MKQRFEKFKLSGGLVPIVGGPFLAPQGKSNRGPILMYYSHVNEIFTDIRKIWYKGRIKRVPRRWLQNYFNDETMARWIIDDGCRCKTYNAMVLSTQGFRPSAIKWLSKLINTYYKIKSKINKTNTGCGLIIRINVLDYEKIAPRIEKYFPRCVRYKLPENQR